MKAKWITLCIAVILIGFFITMTVKQLSTPHELNTNELEVKIKDIYNAEVQTLVKEKINLSLRSIKMVRFLK